METMMLVSLVNLVGAAVALIVGIPKLRDAVEVSQTVVIEMEPNTDADAIETCLRLFEEAEHEIVMYDDGDGSKGSIYQSEALVELLKRKLDGGQFSLQCVLNDPTGNTRFETELDGLKGVSIRRRTANPKREHYKIVDNRKAYVSCHDRGENVRGRKLIDCTNVQERRRRPHPLALQPYFADFEENAA